MLRSLVLLALVIGVTGCDQASKRYAEDHLVTHANRGMAFSIDVPQPLLLAIGLAGIALVAFLLWRRRRELSAQTVALALILAGAAGNVIDRIARGHVVDFLHLPHWPVFNVAGVALALGGGLLVVTELASPKAR